MDMPYQLDFSVIVPVWRGAIKYLPKLFDSIPDKNEIEIIVIDNSKEPISREDILSPRRIRLLHSAPERHAGGSRNDGISVAKGRWLLFADADDYYTPNAFDIFYNQINTDAEIVYTKPKAIYEDTGEPAIRGDKYAKLVHDFCIGTISEEELRMGFPTPWCKMVSHALVDRYELRYDEIRASNDSYFSLTTGFYAKKIKAVDDFTYIVTVNKGSLTRLRTYDVLYARLYAELHCNQFKKAHGLSKYQGSVMYYLFESRHFGLLKTWDFICMIIKAHQNPLIGWKRWWKTAKKNKKKDLRESKYIVR